MIRPMIRKLAHGRMAWGAALFLALAAWAPGSAARADEEKPSRAVIHFADLGGIENWRADGPDAILIEGRNKGWYRATFFGSCIGLQFAETIGFVTDSGGDLDRFSSLLVDGERCWFRTFEKLAVAPEPKKKENKG